MTTTTQEAPTVPAPAPQAPQPGRISPTGEALRRAQDGR